MGPQRHHLYLTKSPGEPFTAVIRPRDMRIWRAILLPVLLLALGLTVAQPVQAVAVQKKVLINFSKVGGFAGFDDRVTVYTNGCARMSRRSGDVVAQCLTKGEVRRLAMDLSHLVIGRSDKPPMGADFLTYTLAYRGHKASRHNSIPRTWRPVVRDLEKLLDKYIG